ncbi:DoxX family membrane protein [Lyngbya aestuarii]|uniref:DoxX family membrane protein n=1 Tax=Lyngbya aestuarii TaxID=118322 RepID=UPI00403DCD8C
MNYIPLFARIFLAIVFLNSGISKLFGFAETQQMMTERGLPVAGLLLVGNIVFQLVGATSLVVGYKVRWGAILLILFLIPTTLVFHNFLADPGETNSFLKNLALIGALMMVYYFGAGPVSFDARSQSSEETTYSSSQH